MAPAPQGVGVFLLDTFINMDTTPNLWKMFIYLSTLLSPLKFYFWVLKQN